MLFFLLAIQDKVDEKWMLVILKFLISGEKWKKTELWNWAFDRRNSLKSLMIIKNDCGNPRKQRQVNKNNKINDQILVFVDLQYHE